MSCRSFAQNQKLGFQKILIEVNGVPFNQFVAIVQDKEGFLWFGTEEGLLKYDGYEANLYKNNPEDSNSLGDNYVRKLYVDVEGDLWAGHNRGLSRYKANCDCFVNYQFTSSPKSVDIESIFQKNVFGIVKTSVSAITEDQSKQVLAATMGGDLFRYNRKSDTFLPFLNDPQKPGSMLSPFINVLLVDQHNNLWIGAGSRDGRNIGSLIRFNLDTGKTKRFVHDPDDSYSLVDSRVTTMLEDQQGRILVGTFKNGLHYYNPEAENFSRLLFNPVQPNTPHAPLANEKVGVDYPAIRILHQDRTGGLWVGNYGIGLHHFDAQTGKLTTYAYDQGQPNEFINNKFISLFEDRQGQLWLGTHPFGGLFKLDTYAKKFNWFLSLKRAQRSCESKTAPGVFWISSMGEGLRRLEEKTGVITTYLHDENNANSIGHNHVRAVHEDENGIVWIGLGDGGYGGYESGEGGLDRLDQKTGILHHYTFKNKDKPNFNWSVYAIHEDGQGRLWLDTGLGGLFRSDRQKKNFESYPIVGSEDSEIWMVSDNNKNALWAIDFTKKIMHRFDPEKDQFFPIIKGDAAESLLEDESGYWIPTWRRGLIHYDPSTGITKRYTEEDGLPTNETVDILSTKVGIYWVATRKGITKFDAGTKTFHNGGMPRGSFHPIWLKSKDGQLFFGAEEGILAFYPEEVASNPVPPELVFKKLQISGEPFHLKINKAGKIKNLELTSRQNDINVTYAGLHFSDPDQNKYQYKLSPFDRDWIDAGTQRSVQYTNLEPGEYLFQVKAANSDAVWTEEALILPFSIHTAWWKSWWFYVISITFIASTSYWFYRFQLSKKLAVQESKRLQEINQLKTNLYNNITHEFRTPLTVIQGMAEEIKQNPGQEQETKINLIKKNSTNLLALVNQILDLSKLQAGKVNLDLQQKDIIIFLKYLVETNESFAKLQNIGLQFYSEEDELFMDFDPKKVEQILTNLISNAIKFTPEYGKVLVVAKKISQHHQPRLQILIKDNGIGISSEQQPYIFDRFHQANPAHEDQGTGIGLALVKELVGIMGATISVESELNKGTTFSLLFPIQNKAPTISHTEGPAFKPMSSSEDFVKEDALYSDHDFPILLIIEDNADVTYYLRTCLQDQYQILTSRNGKKGIEKAFEILPDIIISDVMMPVMDGFEVCATLKEDGRTSHIPIILLTAKATSEDKLIGLTHGADAFLIKPFEKEELVIRLHKLLEIRETLQKKYSSTLISSQTSNITLETKEDSFIEETEKIILSHLAEEDFSIHELARQLHLSRSQVHRKIKALSGMSAAIYIRHIRLQKAKELLASTPLSISEIAYQVGFKTSAYFSQAFKETFGESPNATRK